MFLKNQVQLISYPDSLGNDLQELHFVLKKYFPKAFGGIHILPFYPSSADRGFCPLTYNMVDPNFGTWEDVQKIGNDFNLAVDFIPNHISRQSEYFQDYLKNGRDSEYYDLFLQIKKLYPSGTIPKEELKEIYLRKPDAPEFLIQFPDGKKEKIWQTFESDQQIDLDINSPVYKKVYQGFLLYLLRRNVKLIRLDAIGYVTKKAGTSCFFVEPEIWDFLNWIKNFSDAFEAELLPELHGHYSYQLKFAEQGFRVYDFVLPFMTLHALYDGKSKNLKNWLKICPKKQITTLDTHDGIPVKDCEDLMEQEEIDRTVKNVLEHGASVNYNYDGDGNAEVYQLDITYYSALGQNDDAYLTARAVQFYTPGIPQVYYVGALAGKNDTEALARFEGEKVGGWGREINRHNYSLEELSIETKRPIVQRLIKLMEFRNNYKAFDGRMEVLDSEDNRLIIQWQTADLCTTLNANLEDHTFEITYTDQDTLQEKTLIL